MAQFRKKPLVVTVCPNFKQALKDGFHPEEEQDLKLGRVEFRTIDEVYSKRFPLLEGTTIKRDLDSNNILVFDYLKGGYRNLLSPNTAHEMIISRAIAYKEILLALGAKEVSYKTELTEKTRQQTKGKIDGGKGPASGKAEADYQKKLQEDLKGIFVSKDPNNKPMPIDDAEEELYKFNMEHELGLVSLINRVKTRRKTDPNYTLSGTEYIKVEVSKSLSESFDAALEFSYLAAKVKAELQTNSQNELLYIVELSVDFGE